jgi:hypothetical protein
VWENDIRTPTIAGNLNTLTYLTEQPMLFARLEPIFLGPSKINVRVFDNAGKPVGAGTNVYLFKGNGRCNCDTNQSPAKCVVDSDACQQTGNNGLQKNMVSFCALANDTKYTWSVNPRCAGASPCATNSDCTYVPGTDGSAKTPKNGGTMNKQVNLP